MRIKYLNALIARQWEGGFMNNKRNTALRMLVICLYKSAPMYRKEIVELFTCDYKYYDFDEMVSAVESMAKQAIEYFSYHHDLISNILFSRICVSYSILTCLN